MKNSGLSSLFESFKVVKADEGFGNLVSVALEDAEVRDSIMDELGDDLIAQSEIADDEDDIKKQALEDDDMERLIDRIPETEIDDASVAAGKIANANVPVDEEEYIGAPMEEVMTQIEYMIPDTEEI